MSNSNPNNDIVTKQDFAEYFEKVNLLTTGVLIVLFIGLLALIVAVISPILDAWRFKSSTYEDLRDKIVEQNTKIDILYKQSLEKEQDVTIRYK